MNPSLLGCLMVYNKVRVTTCWLISVFDSLLQDLVYLCKDGGRPWQPPPFILHWVLAVNLTLFRSGRKEKKQTNITDIAKPKATIRWRRCVLSGHSRHSSNKAGARVVIGVKCSPRHAHSKQSFTFMPLPVCWPWNGVYAVFFYISCLWKH